MKEVVPKMARQRLAASTWWCGPRPLYPRGGPKRRDNYPEGLDHPVAPNRLESEPHVRVVF